MNKSIFQIIKKQNGEAFAKRIRKFDSGIFEIENLPVILKYAGRNPEPLLEYLESLKKVQIIETVSDEDPFSLLDKAGYHAYLADTLDKQNAISKYFEKDEMICTFGDAQRYRNYYIIHAVKKNVEEIKRKDFLNPKREDEYGRSVISIQILKTGGFIKITNRYNHTVDHPDNTFYSNPDEIIYGLSGALKKHFGVDFSSHKITLLPDGYFLFNDQILKYYKETNNVYFGQGFYLKDGAIELVDKNSQFQVDEFIIDLKNKKVLNPSQSNNPLGKVLADEILNETLQVKNNKGVLSLHATQGEILKVKEGCLKELTLYKATFLPCHFLNHHTFIERFKAPLVQSVADDCLTNCPNLKEVELKKLDVFESDFCYGTRCLIQADKLQKDGFLFFDSLIFSPLKNKFVTSGYFGRWLIEVLNRTISLTKVMVQKKGNETHLLLGKEPFLVFKEGKLVEIHFEWYNERFGLDSVFSDLPDLEVFSSKNMRVLGRNNLSKCPKLKEVYLENVEEFVEGNLSFCDSLELVHAPHLVMIGRNCLSHNKNYKKISFQKLYKAEQSDCLSHSGYEEIDLPSLVYAGRNFCSNNPCLIKVSVQNLRNLGEYSFSKLDKVQELSFSSLQYIEGRNLVQDNPLLKKASFHKLVCLPEFCLQKCPSLEEAYLDKVYRLEGFSLTEKKNFKYLYAPAAEVIGEKFLKELPEGFCLEAPLLTKLSQKITRKQIDLDRAKGAQSEREA
ncbi:MAG: leucine-rich repeat protein [Alphaproteobacteria bacterium]|nr:leucine-rich repeat protein [Alphaproteobacteria bacterium]